MLIKTSFSALLSLIAFYSSAAHSQSLSSTYMETKSCRTIEEGDDKFTLRCNAPSGKISAILSYWDGRAFVVYEPFFTQQAVKAHMRDVSNAATRVFGQKLEWRLRMGEKQPCAAIIRVYSTKGGVLVVNDMATGKHLGDAKTNEQARTIADKACLTKVKDSAIAKQIDKVVPKTEPAIAVESNIATKSTETVELAAKRAETKFKAVYFESGIIGVIDEIKACYQNLLSHAELSELAYCAALDIIAGNVDTMMSQGNPDFTQSYFGLGLETDKRIESEFVRLNFDTQQRVQFDEGITAALEVTVHDDVSDNENSVIIEKHQENNVELIKSETVFDFD